MNKNRAQTLIEFCFASTVFMLLLFGMVQTVRWVMMDLSERRYDYDAALTQGGGDAATQLRDPNFHKMRSIDAAIFNK